ncbi:MAG: (2Fe-2S)-binding protein [Candidatus Dormibacteraeota bacterium]|nr:(2Fe-2S)-binding protein [Candidatus Dormibacteraeota bacterium]MBV9525739.1 (2Fe-2S)-binding protein [Candidatus Dormibacteraeota bacterium]
MTQTPAAPGPDDGRVGVTIDGREVRVPKGTLVLDAATELGIHIPIYCAHAKLDPVAVCRMCLVHIEKFPKPQPACATTVAEGMVVTTNNAEVTKLREGVLEFLLVNHPLDCPVCDRGGECDLQDFTFRYGPGTSRFPITEKVHFAKALPLSQHIELDQERCILCWRCVRYYDEITGEKEIVLQQRGVQTLVTTFNGEQLKSNFQGNLPEVCPVGALTHREYRFRARPWELQRAPSVCPECSYGCNINADSRDFEIKRFASRDNPLVDDMWLCDRGRYSFPQWNTSERVRRPQLRPRGGEQRDVTAVEAISAAARELRAVVDQHGSGAVGVLGSALNTNEELWLLGRLARDVIGTPHIDHQLEPFEKLDPAEHALGIADIEECDALVVLGAEPEAEAPVLTLRLFKAERKRGARVHRLDHGADPSRIASAVRGAKTIGVIADETNRAHAARVAAAITGGAVRRLTVTRGVNGRGAKDMGVLPGLAAGYRSAPSGKHGREILEAAASGALRALLILGPNPALETAGDVLQRALARADSVVVIDSRPGVCAGAATVLIPGHAFFEKHGTVTNLEGRVQRIRPALPPATPTPTETRVLSSLAAELGARDWDRGEPSAVNRALRAALAPYAAAGNGGRATWVAEAVA